LTVKVTGPVVVLIGLLVSVAFTVTVDVPAMVGVPVTTQPAPRVSPAGSVPAVITQLYGAVPPETPIVPLYGVPTVAAGGEVMVSVPAAATVMLSGPVTVSAGLLESLAFTCSVEVPAVVGVPLTTQLAESVSPAGRVPPVCTQLYGAVPPETPMVALYGTPTVAPGSVDNVSVSPLGRTVRLTGPVIVLIGLLESVAVTVRFDVPAVVGVPVMAQPAPSVNPAGNVPLTMRQL
jgi:hypothetical protein